MKKIFLILTIISTYFVVQGQNDTLYILNEGSVVYKRAIVNIDSIISYPPKTIPEILTSAVYNLDSTSASCGGRIISDGYATVTVRGICWSKNPEPTIADNKTIDGSGTGSFISRLAGLQNNVTYYARAYITDGEYLIYGNQQSFVAKRDSNFPEMVEVTGGTFTMGCTVEQGNDCEGDEVPHQVTLSSFRISKYEITNKQFVTFLNAVNVGSNGVYNGLTMVFGGNGDGYPMRSTPSGWEVKSGYENRPAVMVTGVGASEYCHWVGGRLPTEAEWEFAARGGNQSNGYKYAGSNNLNDVAWHNQFETKTIGLKQPNELGLYDMSGNVSEWCIDSYDGDAGNSLYFIFFIRGGGYNDSAIQCRVSERRAAPGTGMGSGDLGFRVVFP